MNTINLTRTFCKMLSGALLLAFLAAGMQATPALAQDDQAYKKAYNAGLEAYKAKNLDEAHKQWSEAAKLAAAAGDNEIAKKSKYYVAQLDYKRGVKAYKAEDYETAIKHHQAGTALYPDYGKNLYGEAMALKKMGRIDDALAKFKQIMETDKDRKTVTEARERIKDHFYYQASSAVSKQNPSNGDADRALAALQASQEYLEPDADFYYYTAVAQNIKGDYGSSIASANKALDLHKGSKSDKAKIYFVKGEALMYSGDTAGAKSAFQNAAYGSYKASADHYLKTL